MPFVSVVNLGCRVNRVESDRMTVDFARAGFGLVDEDEADLVVINTCAVTGEAEAKTRKAVRHAVNLPRKPYVVVTGCAVNLHPDSLAELSDRVVIEPMKTDVAARAADLLGFGETGACDGGLDSRELADLLGRSRLGVKIQDGCNNRCTYCIVWKARGPERSVPVDAVLEQVREAFAAGIPEVVLTGVNLGAYDGMGPDDDHVEIDELLDAILTETDIPHVRLSSIEPMDVSERLVRRMAAEPRRVAPFLHLPVQSGCTATLQRMGRPYSAEEFERTVARIREILPAASISGDLIVGFPGETDEEFEQTRAFVERVGFSRLHVFRYSARPGTIAAEMPDQVAPEVMADRSLAIRKLVERTARADAQARIGTTERAVVEYPGRGTLGSFHRVVLDNAPDLAVKSIVDVAIMYMDEEGVLHGRPVLDADE
ncbi:MiaB/RimO family radical SAM methylthiotransferase [Collinsella tanakaei]|uniref:MiaB/RimO family radical SAM methylthiotransferase n=1 Tax=Collinsella sp. An271 TaxID=1965616 RepID=UPI000B379EDE|nr:MiaB/RimO family radical SAM methylthiotransferase [Collinsella sp. An271]MBM6785808.1 MiaB/RimO family radical SAM methylthiotransferase [Collinsella tanakaei]